MPDELDRRAFLVTVATSAAACACGGCPLATFARDRAPAAAAAPVDVGTREDYPRDSVYDDYAKSHGFFIVRAKGRLFAPSSTCTHRKTLLKVKGIAIVCPKHGARFAADGSVTKAPAKRALPRHAVSIDDAGRITVDPSRTFAKSDWDDAASFLPVP